MDKNVLNEELKSLIQEHALSEFQDEILDSARPAIYISLDKAERGEIGRSRVGDTPDLPASLSWPKEPRWGYRCFLVQINFSEIPHFESSPLPEEGMLYLFVNEAESDADQVIFYNGKEPLESTVAPSSDEMMTDWYDDLAVYTLKFEVGLDVPRWTTNEYDALILWLGEGENADRLDKLGDALSKGHIGKLLGYDAGLGHDAKEDAYVVREENPEWLYKYEKTKQLDMTRAQKWRNLLYLDSVYDIELTFGDAGYLQVLVHADDLQPLNLARAYVAVESS